MLRSPYARIAFVFVLGLTLTFSLLSIVFAADQRTSPNSPAALFWDELPAGSASGDGISQSTPQSKKAAIATAPNGNIYVAWEEELSADTEIYLKMWNGNSWQSLGSSASSGGISNNGGDSIRPAIAIDPDGRPVVVWRDKSNGNWEIYAKRWNGNSWTEFGGTSASGGGVSNFGGSSSAPPSIAISPSGTVMVAWSDKPTGQTDQEVYVRQFKDDKWQRVGTKSASEGGVSNNSGDSWSPHIAVLHDSWVAVAWHDHTPGDSQIYLKLWKGEEWQAVDASASGGGLSDTNGNSRNASVIAHANGDLSVIWQENVNGKWQIYGKQWQSGGSWKEIGNGSASGGGISQTNFDSYRPRSAETSNGQLIITWYTTINSYTEVYAKQWTGAQWSEIGAGSASGGGISQNAKDSSLPDIAIRPGSNMPVVAWEDNSGDRYQIYLRTLIDGEAPTPTNTPPATATPTNTPIPTATQTPLPTATNTPVPPPSATPTNAPPTPTQQPGSTPNPTATPTVTLTPSAPTATPAAQLFLPSVQFGELPLIQVGFVGRWEGTGQIRGAQSFDVGIHTERRVIEHNVNTALLKLDGSRWYDPNPLGWAPQDWISHLTYGEGVEVPERSPDSDWKWDFPWLLPYSAEPQAGTVFWIDGQEFRVKGPIAGKTAFGKSTTYWEFTNMRAFVYWDNGGSLTYRVHPGDIVLHFDATKSILLHRDITRRDYLHGAPSGNSIRYEVDLTSSTLYD